MDRISEFVFSDEVESKECTERSPVTESTGEDANASASASDDAYENLNGSVADAGQRAKGCDKKSPPTEQHHQTSARGNNPQRGRKQGQGREQERGQGRGRGRGRGREQASSKRGRVPTRHSKVRKDYADRSPERRGDLKRQRVQQELSGDHPLKLSVLDHVTFGLDGVLDVQADIFSVCPLTDGKAVAYAQTALDMISVDVMSLFVLSSDGTVVRTEASGILEDTEELARSVESFRMRTYLLECDDSPDQTDKFAICARSIQLPRRIADKGSDVHISVEDRKTARVFTADRPLEGQVKNGPFFATFDTLVMCTDDGAFMLAHAPEQGQDQKQRFRAIPPPLKPIVSKVIRIGPQLFLLEQDDFRCTVWNSATNRYAVISLQPFGRNKMMLVGDQFLVALRPLQECKGKPFQFFDLHMVLASEYVEVPTEVTALMYTSMDEISFTDPVYEKMSRSALIPVGKQVWVEGFYPFSLPSRSARKRVFENDTIHPIASGFIAMLVEKARRELLLQSTISNTVKDLKPM